MNFATEFRKGKFSMTEKMQTFSHPGQRLRYVRDVKKMTLQDVANVLGVANSSIHRWETDGEITKSTALALQAGLGIGADWLLEGVGAPFVDGKGTGGGQKEQGERLRFARGLIGLTTRRVSEILGVGEGTVGQMESGDVKITKTWAMALELATGIQWRWVLQGEEPPLPPESAGGTGRGAVVPPVGVLSLPLVGGANSRSGNPYPIRFSDAERLLAGVGGGDTSELVVVQIRGDAMVPTLRDQDLVLVDGSGAAREQITPDALYLVRRSPEDLDARPKRVRLSPAGDLVLKSDNQAYPERTLERGGKPLQDFILGRILCLLMRDLVAAAAPESDW